ncbi:MAG: cell division protein FtsA, partial [Chloroflexota bacterium]
MLGILRSIYQFDYFRILGVGIVPSKRMRKAMITNLNDVSETVRESVREAERTSGMHIDTVFIGITGSHISSFNTRSRLSLSADDQPVSDKDVKQLLEHARTIRMSAERELLHALPHKIELDGTARSEQPLGLIGSRLETDVHVITAASSAVRNLIKGVRQAGITTREVILQPLASGEAILRPVEKDVGIAVVDIGAGTTDIAVFKDGSIYHTAAIPVAGFQVTRDLSLGLSLTYEEAEELKVKFASLKGSEQRNLTIAPDKEISFDDMMDIITARVQETLQLVWVELGGDELSRLIPAGVVLTGGASKLPGMAELATRVFRVPCRVGVPRNITGMVDHLHDPAFATSVGLLHWGAKYAGKEMRSHHQPSPLTQIWLKVKRRFWRGWWS